jgi:hypothetical protein
VQKNTFYPAFRGRSQTTFTRRGRSVGTVLQPLEDVKVRNQRQAILQLPYYDAFIHTENYVVFPRGVCMVVLKAVTTIVVSN